MTTTHLSTTHYQHTLVVGIGATGWSVVRYLLARGETIAVADSRAHPPYLDQLREQFADVPVFLGAFSEQVFALTDRIVVSPGIALDTPAIATARARGSNRWRIQGDTGADHDTVCEGKYLFTKSTEKNGHIRKLLAQLIQIRRMCARISHRYGFSSG